MLQLTFISDTLLYFLCSNFVAYITIPKNKRKTEITWKKKNNYNRFIFQIINSLIESWRVSLTCLIDCKYNGKKLVCVLGDPSGGLLDPLLERINWNNVHSHVIWVAALPSQSQISVCALFYLLTRLYN